MITLKNRTREAKVYQYARDVSAGPVRPRVISVVRGKHNPKTGEKSRQEKQITVGGVLTIPARSSVVVPDVLAEHPALKRDIAGRKVSQKAVKTTKKASVAPPEAKAKPRVRKPKAAQE